MALTIKRDGSTMSDSINRENEISSAAKTSSQEETSGAQGTTQYEKTADTQKQTKAAQDLANAKKFEGQLQAFLNRLC